MTATNPAPLICPQCQSTNTEIGGSGNGMCFECAHVWDPATVTALPRPALEPFALPSTGEVFDAQPTPVDAPNPDDWPPSWEGLRAFREAGGIITDELWWADIMGGAPDQLDPRADVEPEPPVEVQAALLLAAEILAAGITAAYTLANPDVQFVAPTGYLPADKAMLPIVEQACAVAIGMLIDVSGHTVREYAQRFGVELETQDQGDPTMEEAHGEGSGEAE